jgi:hypothetical protein
VSVLQAKVTQAREAAAVAEAAHIAMVLAIETSAQEVAAAWEREAWVRVLSGGGKHRDASLCLRGGRRLCQKDRSSRG